MKKSDRIKVWNKYRQRCSYCGKSLEYKDMQVDHLIPRLRGRRPDSLVEVFDNFMPSCRRCNHYKHTYCLESFRGILKSLDRRVNAHYINKVALDYGIILEVKPWDGVFYFEKDVVVEEVTPEETPVVTGRTRTARVGELVKYKDKEAAPYQGMVVGQRYKVLDVTKVVGGVPWYEVLRDKPNDFTRWISSCCFEKIKDPPKT